MARHCTCFRPWSGPTIALLFALTEAPSARAYEEQASLDGSLGYGFIANASELPSHIASVEAGGGIGLGDVAIVRGSLGYAYFRDSASAPVHGGRLRLEALYLLDVLQVVPFFGGGGSLLLASEGGTAQVHPGGHLVVGLDYLLSRQWVMGIDVRPGVVVDDGQVRSVTEVAVRVSRMFELF